MKTMDVCATVLVLALLPACGGDSVVNGPDLALFEGSLFKLPSPCVGGESFFAFGGATGSCPIGEVGALSNVSVDDSSILEIVSSAGGETVFRAKGQGRVELTMDEDIGGGTQERRSRIDVRAAGTVRPEYRGTLGYYVPFEGARTLHVGQGASLELLLRMDYGSADTQVFGSPEELIMVGQGTALEVSEQADRYNHSGPNRFAGSLTFAAGESERSLSWGAWSQSVQVYPLSAIDGIDVVFCEDGVEGACSDEDDIVAGRSAYMQVIPTAGGQRLDAAEGSVRFIGAMSTVCRLSLPEVGLTTSSRVKIDAGEAGSCELTLEFREFTGGPVLFSENVSWIVTAP